MELIVDERYQDFINSHKVEYVLKNKDCTYGMWKIRINNEFRSLARVIAEKHLSKELPKDILIDHVDRNTSNNLLPNLRLTTHKLNLNNKSGMSPTSEVKSSFRLDYGRNSEGNRIRTPRLYGKSIYEIERISRHFHSLCQGSTLSPSTVEDEIEFMKIFRDLDHYKSWMSTYGRAIENNQNKIKEHYLLIETFSTKPFGTTLDKF